MRYRVVRGALDARTTDELLVPLLAEVGARMTPGERPHGVVVVRADSNEDESIDARITYRPGPIAWLALAPDTDRRWRDRAIAHELGHLIVAPHEEWQSNRGIGSRIAAEYAAERVGTELWRAALPRRRRARYTEVADFANAYLWRRTLELAAAPDADGQRLRNRLMNLAIGGAYAAGAYDAGGDRWADRIIRRTMSIPVMADLLAPLLEARDVFPVGGSGRAVADFVGPVGDRLEHSIRRVADDPRLVVRIVDEIYGADSSM